MKRSSILLTLVFSWITCAQGATPERQVWDLQGSYNLQSGDAHCAQQIQIKLSCSHCDTDHPYRSWIYIPNFVLAAVKHPQNRTTTGIKWEIEGYLNLGPYTHSTFQFPGKTTLYSTNVTWDGSHLHRERTMTYHCKGILCARPKEVIEREVSTLEKDEAGSLHINEYEIRNSKRRIFGWKTEKEVAAKCTYSPRD